VPALETTLPHETLARLVRTAASLTLLPARERVRPDRLRLCERKRRRAAVRPRTKVLAGSDMRPIPSVHGDRNLGVRFGRYPELVGAERLAVR
jgi:hypothetical protein